MRPEAPALLWDARRATELVLRSVEDLDLDRYERDPLVESAVERQFTVLGEAPNRLHRLDPQTASRVPDVAQIVAFRNILVHG